MALGGWRMTELSAYGAELPDSIPAEDAGKGEGEPYHEGRPWTSEGLLQPRRTPRRVRKRMLRHSGNELYAWSGPTDAVKAPSCGAAASLGNGAARDAYSHGRLHL
jgi:hypothetical protein